jgi:LPS-assembly protein
VPSSNLRPRIYGIAAMASLFLLSYAGFVPPVAAQEENAGRVRTEIPHRDGMVVLVSDFQKKISGTAYRIQGNVRITFRDYVVTGDEAVYDEETGDGYIAGKVHFSQNRQWLSCSRAEFNFHSQTGVFYDASGYTDRQFFVKSQTIRKTGPDTYRFDRGTITACKGKKPKWSFGASRTDIRIDHTAQLRNAVFKIKDVPVFYLPYVILPMAKNERSSGFMLFRTGNSTSKGRSFSEGWYQTLGRSADLTIYGDYFSRRGLALGSRFRVQPNPVTRLTLQVYGIKDKLDQGGIQLTVDGESWFKDNWRAVAKANIASNFKFRQVFSDSFHSATIPEEQASAFLTRNHNSFSTNIAFERQEVLFPLHPLVIRKLPSLEFISLGTPLGRSPLIFSFRASLDGLSRQDSRMETQRLIQRMDFYPRLTLRLPSFKGFSLVPSVGIRETYYGARLSEDSPFGVENRGLHRRYAELNIELRTPILERNFQSSRFGRFLHTVEPFVTYRRIYGIKELDQTIRFDEDDAIADTNEIEYGIMNRFFSSKSTASGGQEKREFISFGLVQKYYFDPTFGGAFKEGQSNAFYPLDSVTGFYQTGTPRNFAPLSAIFRLSSRQGLYTDVRADFDARLKRWRNGSITTLWQRNKLFFSGTYFRILELEKGMPAGNHIQGEIRYGSLDRGFSSSFSISYNFQSGQLLNSRTRIHYTWDCCGVGLDFNQFDLGLRTESRFSFSFALKGIGNFGNIDRQQGLF